MAALVNAVRLLGSQMKTGKAIGVSGQAVSEVMRRGGRGSMASSAPSAKATCPRALSTHLQRHTVESTMRDEAKDMKADPLQA